MGIMICETHGRVGFVETCSHIAREIDGGRVPAGHRFSIGGHIFLCDDCFRSLGCEKFVSLAELPVEEAWGVTDGRMEAFEASYEAIEGRSGFCLNCVADLEARSVAAPVSNMPKE